MTQTPPAVVAPRSRRAIPLFLVLAAACLIVMILVAGGVVGFITNWAVWLGAGLLAVVLHLWFNVEL